MPGTSYPITHSECRKLFINESDYWKMAGCESYRIRTVTDFPFHVGQKVACCVNNYNSVISAPTPLYRFVVGIYSPIPLYLDEDAIVLELSPFNYASL